MNPDSSPEPGAGPPVLVSACLLGVACTHRAESKASPAVTALAARRRLIPVCPEVAGGLPTPRPAAERTADGRVLTGDGEDVTDFYRRGADHAVALARAARVSEAVLKARSPSCGCHQIYDGTHRGVLVDGEGVTAAALRLAGVDVISEEDLPGPTTAGSGPDGSSRAAAAPTWPGARVDRRGPSRED
jgi:uncharacterized protein YbbK (DUF523 family)